MASIQSWAELKPYVDRLAKQVREMPAPPVPDDTWGEKMNMVTRTVHTMQEQLTSRMEQEDALRAQEEDE